jgi:hypothetical protein
MGYLGQTAPSGPVAVTLTVGGPTTTVPTTVPPATPPGPTNPGVSAPPPHQPLPLTGAPVVAGLDLALLLAVAGATLVTVANRLAGREVFRPGL